MKAGRNKQVSKRDRTIITIDYLNSQVQNLKLDIERLKAEMSIMHYIHKNEVQNMNLHEEMTTEVEKMVVAQELEKTLNEINPQSNT